jgi:hypothetical protein
MARRIAKSSGQTARGNLRIGDHWNSITIIALSQSNPLKAVAELVVRRIWTMLRVSGNSSSTRAPCTPR